MESSERCKIYIVLFVFSISFRSILGGVPDCSFENDLCGWTVDETEAQWIDSSDTSVVPKPTNGTQFMMLNSTIGLQVGVLVSPPFNLTTSAQNLHLGLWMTAIPEDANLNLKVYLKSVTDISWSMVDFVLSSTFDDAVWQNIVVSIVPIGVAPYQLRIEGSVDADDQNIALDYVFLDGQMEYSNTTTTSPPTESPIDCSFEGTLCDWTMDENELLWIDSSDTTVVPPPINGKMFMLLNESDSDVEVGTLTSPEFTLQGPSGLHICLWMTSADTEDLNVKVSLKTGDEWKLLILIYSSKLKSAGWADLRINLTPDDDETLVYQVQVNGSVAAQDQYIALDYVYLELFNTTGL